MTSSLYALIFVSSATEILTDQETSLILKEHRDKAKIAGLTGLVVFGSGSVLRYVEGEKESVLEQYEQAKQNYMHSNMIKVLEVPVDYRLFEDYPLAYLPISGYHKQLNDFKEPGMKAYLEECLSIPSPVTTVINDFVKNNV